MRLRRVPTTTGNQLLRSLAERRPDLYEQLEGSLVRVTIPGGTVLSSAGEMPKAAYFVDSGVVSVVGHTEGGDSLELAFVGHEGVTGVGWLMTGTAPPYSFVAQLPVTARRLSGPAVRLVSGSDAHVLNHLIALYAQFGMTQLAQSALCARFHTAAERLSRWLLLTAIRVGSDELPLTHEFLSQMVGAPRSLVTEAAGTLRRAGIIGYSRGRIVINNRPQLEARACECYSVLRSRLRAYERLVRAAGRQ